MIKRTTISLRIDKKTKDKLQALEDKSGMSKSDVVRQGIKMMYEEYLSDDVDVTQVSEDKPSDENVGNDTGVFNDGVNDGE